MADGACVRAFDADGFVAVAAIMLREVHFLAAGKVGVADLLAGPPQKRGRAAQAKGPVTTTGKGAVSWYRPPMLIFDR